MFNGRFHNGLAEESVYNGHSAQDIMGGCLSARISCTPLEMLLPLTAVADNCLSYKF